MSAEFPSPTDVAYDAAGRIAVDTACVRCGYNLRTLLSDGLCPECGDPVRVSIQDFFLHFAPPLWVRGLARGLRLVLIATAMLTILPVVVGIIAGGAALYNVSSMPAGPSWLVYFAGLGQSLQSLTQAAGQVLLIIGLVWLTRPEPTPQRHPEGCTARRIIRLGCWLLPLPLLGHLAMVLSMPAFPAVTPGAPLLPGFVGPWLTTYAWLGIVVGVIGMLVYATIGLALLRHMGALVRRIPRPGLVRATRVMFWGLSFCIGFMIVAYGVVALTVVPKIPAVLAAASASATASAPAALTTYAYTTTAPAVATGVPSRGGAPNVIPIGAATNAPADDTASGDEIEPQPGPPATGPTSLPTTMTAYGASTRSFFTGVMFGACSGVVGGCGTLGFLIATLLVLIRSCSALFAAARAADAVAATAQIIPPPP